MTVYKAISAVSLALSKEGISKDRKNDQQGYKFRGIDDVYNALAPLLATNGLCILPRVLSRECVERTTAKGNAIFYVTVHVEFDLVSADDGSKHTVATYGEAMDTADKATNKAMSAAYKYMAMEVFAIPTEGDNDADATTHEVKSKVLPTKTGWEPSAEARAELDKALSIVRDFLNADMPQDAATYFYGSVGDQEEQLYVWNQLTPSERKAIKSYKEERKAA